jgi:SGNH hydrolase-like domain, acetyltransferase AlgX
MTMQPSTDDATIAQRPRLVSRLRLLPLGVLLLLVATAAVIGVVRGTPVTGGAPAAALAGPGAGSSPAKAARKAEKASQQAAARGNKACMPRFSTGITRQPWRGKARAGSERAYQARIKKENPAYVRGKDGWLFFTDYQVENFSQALGRVTQTRAQEKAWVTYIKKSAAKVKRSGGDYRVIVMPANWDVYPQKLPAWAQALRGTTSLQKLMKDHPELPWIDTRAPLRKAAKKHDTYEPLNSHWTPYGGYVAWQAITKCLRATNPSLAGIGAPPISGVGIEANANEFAPNGVPDGKPARTYPKYAEPHPGVVMTHLPDGAPIQNSADYVTDTVQTPLKTVTAAAQAPGITMLTLRDSTGNALSPLYSWSFGTTVQYAHGISQVGFSPPNLGQLMTTYRPNLVLFVITERFLSQKAPKG